MPLLACAVREVDGESVGEAVERLHVLAYEEALRAEVDAYVVVVEVGGEYGAVAGEYVAAQWLYGGDGVELPLPFGVPCLGVDYGGVDEHEHDAYGHGNDDADHDAEVHQYARAARVPVVFAIRAHFRGGV